eukprot:1008128-Pelagomonas_calceolata.AAC.2
MPSSAATTSTTMSVTAAPLARMAEKALWPGVSRKVSGALPSSGSTTSNAPMCCKCVQVHADGATTGTGHARLQRGEDLTLGIHSSQRVKGGVWPFRYKSVIVIEGTEASDADVAICCHNAANLANPQGSKQPTRPPHKESDTLCLRTFALTGPLKKNGNLEPWRQQKSCTSTLVNRPTGSKPRRSCP